MRNKPTSNSDSSRPSPRASDVEIEDALRNAVDKEFRGNPEQLTIKRIRTDVERQLGLGDGFCKAHVEWNDRSKRIIQSQVDTQEAQNQLPSPQPPRSKRSRPSETKAKAEGGREKPSKPNRGPAKQQNNGDQSVGSPAREGSKSSSTSTKHLSQSSNSSPLSDAEEEERKPIADANHGETIPDGAEEQESESEMSVLLDPVPNPRKRARKDNSGKPRSTKKLGKGASKSAKTQQQDLDPDNEEIKLLQGWLVKCGIRKMWFKELGSCNTPKDKIRHLRGMLKEAGMVGRFSQEKATQIREERELKADLDAVQAGNKQWGKAESDEGTESRPRRKLARGLQELDFLRDNDSDDE
ncbi:MAG: hypothetical protein Q9169_000601 [Polycauliona sp. 2 TL-2023]